MKINYYVLKNTFIIGVLSLVVTVMMGCTSYKETTDLNIYHSKVVQVLRNDSNSIGVFCANKNFNVDHSPAPQLSIVLKEGYSHYVTGYIDKYDQYEKTIYGSLKFDIFDDKPVYEQECGYGKKYPYIYWFTLELKIDYPEGKGKEVRMKEYYEIVNQIKQNKYIDVRAIVVPMASTSITGSAQDARMYFTDEQIRELFSDKE